MRRSRNTDPGRQCSTWSIAPLSPLPLPPPPPRTEWKTWSRNNIAAVFLLQPRNFHPPPPTLVLVPFLPRRIPFRWDEILMKNHRENLRLSLFLSSASASANSRGNQRDIFESKWHQTCRLRWREREKEKAVIWYNYRYNYKRYNYYHAMIRLLSAW